VPKKGEMEKDFFEFENEKKIERKGEKEIKEKIAPCVLFSFVGHGP
jgi:hypothetical protein